MENDEEIKILLEKYVKKILTKSTRPPAVRKVKDAVIHVNSEEEFYEILKTNKIVVAEFSASWCGPCYVYAPIFEQVAKNVAGKAVFVKIDVDATPIVAQRFYVMSVPTTIIFVNGKPVQRIVGVIPEDRLQYYVETYLS